ncbi:MAG: hypothetical protein VYB59_13030, partial [Pseudomonadota bacterium]|nr:hypothetical protein [Pseudomonadota bacterium]
MRYLLGIALILTVAGGIALFAMLSDQAILPASDIESARDLGRQRTSTTLASDSASEAVRLSSVYKEILTVGKGDTLMAMLVDTGIAPASADRAVRTMSRIYKPRRIKPGQDIVLSLKPDPRAKSVELMAMKISPNVERDIVVTWTTNGFQAKAVDRPLTKVAMHASGKIDTSLYVAGVNAGLRQATLAKLIQAFSFDVDFQRDIRRGDAFDVMYEEYRDEDGAVVKSGDILVAELTS